MHYKPTSEQVKNLRRLLIMTQQECADMCLVQCNTWSRYEQGIVQMSAPIWELFKLKAKMVMFKKGQEK